VRLFFSFGNAKLSVEKYKNNFRCEAGALPFKYLGIPIHHRRQLNKEWDPVENRFEKKLGC
jgi:hypothetical protein